ncbi:hypothetical protein CROQUDRAFT_88750 [Cronartium quercuum f. sp. fusiforme G11]|uniref:CCHC-type domain-containing protein n=1 Tax=Cronartium quercuum f. sp. fusiforme G11 TaxID=708437 RepID=A0A9P6NSS1_9BASI|nr:hypothetical protein CROQUDRAFT_88750 [Cronartium quercuum f. sp. fusiforme G11]
MVRAWPANFSEEPVTTFIETTVVATGYHPRYREEYVCIKIIQYLLTFSLLPLDKLRTLSIDPHYDISAKAAIKFSAVTKDLPIKLSSITKLVRDGSTFQHWELDLTSYVSFIPPAMEWADIVNAVIYWTIDRDLSIPPMDICNPYKKVEELRKQFAGVSFAARRHLLRLRDKLQRAGASLADDTFALLLANTMPARFPDILSNFEVAIMKDPTHIVSTSDLTRIVMAADVVHRRNGVASEVNRTQLQPMGSTRRSNYSDMRKCRWCNKQGHIAYDCMKKKEWMKKGGYDKKDAKSKAPANTSKVSEVEIETASGLWDSGATHGQPPKPKEHLEAIKSLKKHEVAFVTQLRSNHIHLNQYLNRFKQLTDPACDCQEGVEIVEHYLFLCHRYEEQRQPLLNNLQNRQLKPKKAILHHPPTFPYIVAFCNASWQLKSRWVWAKISDERLPSHLTIPSA